MEHERAQQQSGNAITGDAQRQQRDHSGANDRVVGRLGSGDALQAAFAELFGVLGSAADFVVAEELCHTAANTGHCAQNACNCGRTQAGGQDADHLFLGDSLLVDLAGVIQLAAGNFEVTQFLHHLGQRDKGDHGGQHVDAVFQSCRTKGEASDAGNSIHAHAGHQQADHAGDEALGQAAAGHTGDQADAHDAQGNAQAGHAANDHAQNQTAEDEQHVVNSEHLRDSLRNQCKIRHQMIPPNRPRAGSEMLKTFLNSRKMAKAETRTTM